MAVPQLFDRRQDGTLIWLVAATCLLMLLAAALALALNGTARTLQAQAGQRLLVQVADGDAARRDATAGEVVARLDRLQPSVHARRMPAAQTEALVMPYLSGVATTDIPVPALIELDGADAAGVGAILRDLPSVQMTAAGAELMPLVRFVRALRGIAIVVTLTATATAGLITMLATRAALARETATLGILHALGATDAQASRLLTGRITRNALIGALGGGGIALLLLLSLSHQLAGIGMTEPTRFGAASWAILAALPFALAAAATVVAQATLALLLRHAP